MIRVRDGRPTLPTVTLVAVTSIGLDATVRALSASIRQVGFGRALLLSDRRPSAFEGTSIEWTEIPPIRSKAEYSRFMLHELADHVQTSHVLCVQWDGFVLNGDLWDDEFLEYDYIGAIWPNFSDGHTVGNGGFSLRSRRLLQALKNLPYDGSTAEDLVICRVLRPQLEQLGFRIAPEEVARRFAYERTAPTGKEFGFHGAFNLVELINSREAFTILKSLEAQVLNRNEHRELLRWAIRKGYPKIASLLICRILRQRVIGT